MHLANQSLKLNFIRAYWQNADQNWHYPSYHRPYNWLIHTRSGKGVVHLDNYSIELLPNTLALLPLNTHCHYQCIEPMQIGACAFTLKMPSGLDIFQLYQAPEQSIDFYDQNLLAQIINLNPNESNTAENSAQYFSALAAIYQLLTPIISNSIIKQNIDAHYIRLEKIFSHIDKNLTSNLTIPDLAALHGTSTAHFSRWFTSIVEVSPKKFINQKRIDLACKQLLLSDERIEKIAFNCGYEDPLYFSKSFKKITGLTPRDYRKTQLYDLF